MRRLLVLLSACGVLLAAPGVAQASVSPDSIVFGNTTQDQTQWVSVYNTTPNTWYMYGAYFYDGEAYSTPYNFCSYSELAPYSSCSIEIQFNAGDTNLRAGWYYDTLDIYHYDYGSGWGDDYVYVSGGKDVAGTYSVSPGDVDFGTHTDAVIQTVTVRNDENQPIDVTHGTINGGAPFSITVDACGRRLASGDSCSVDVRFDPGSNPGTYNDSMALTVSDSGGDHAERVSLKGEVPPPAPPQPADLVPTPNLIRFGKAQRPLTQSVTLTHDSQPADAHIDAVAGSGAFTIVNDSCSGRTLSAGQSCTFRVRFQGSTPGRYRSNVTVVSANSLHGTYDTGVRGTWVGARSVVPYVSRGKLNRRSFSPRVHDGRSDTVRYRFRSGIVHPSGRRGPLVTVEIWSGSFTRVVRSWTFLQRRAAIHGHSITWNGRNQNGRLVRPGSYHVRTVVRAPASQGEGVRSSRWHTIRVRRGR